MRLIFAICSSSFCGKFFILVICLSSFCERFCIFAIRSSPFCDVFLKLRSYSSRVLSKFSLDIFWQFLIPLFSAISLSSCIVRFTIIICLDKKKKFMCVWKNFSCNNNFFITIFFIFVCNNNNNSYSCIKIIFLLLLRWMLPKKVGYFADFRQVKNLAVTLLTLNKSKMLII